MTETLHEWAIVWKVIISFEIVVFITAYVITAAVCIARNTHKPNKY